MKTFKQGDHVYVLTPNYREGGVTIESGTVHNDAVLVDNRSQMAFIINKTIHVVWYCDIYHRYEDALVAYNAVTTHLSPLQQTQSRRRMDVISRLSIV